MVQTEILVRLLSFFLMYTILKVNSKVIVKITNLECLQDTDWINMTCKLKAINWKKSLVNVDAELTVDVNKVMVHAQVFKRFNTYQPFPLKADFNFCSMLGGRGSNYFFVPLFNELMTKYTNLNHSCPFLKGEKLFAKNLDFQPFDFMNMNVGAGGTGRYRLDINIYVNGSKTRTGVIVGYADVTEENRNVG